MAMTSWPRLSSLELPSGAAGSVTGASTRTSARSVSGSSPTTRATRLRPSTVVTLTRAAPSDDVAVGQHQPVGRHDDTRPGAAVAAVAAGLDVEPHHGGADAIDHVDHGAGVGIEERLVVRRDRRRGARSGVGWSNMGWYRGASCDGRDTGHRAQVADGLGVRSQIWGAPRRRGRGGRRSQARDRRRQEISCPYIAGFGHEFTSQPYVLLPLPAAIALVGLVLLLVGCGEAQKQAAPPPPTVTVASPSRAPSSTGTNMSASSSRSMRLRYARACPATSTRCNSRTARS